MSRFRLQRWPNTNVFTIYRKAKRAYAAGSTIERWQVRQRPDEKDYVVEKFNAEGTEVIWSSESLKTQTAVLEYLDRRSGI